MKKNNDSIEVESNSKQPRVEVDLVNLPEDHSLRKKCDYHSSDRDQIQRAFYKNELINPLTMIFQ
jgi:hypothetical protein